MTSKTAGACESCGQMPPRIIRGRCYRCYRHLLRESGPIRPPVARYDAELEALCLAVPNTSLGFASRVFAKIDFSGDCWQWTGIVTPEGYGTISRGSNRGGIGAHRAVWELLVSPIPPGLQYDHLCFNRGCVNPDHGEVVTAAENILRSHNMAARHARRKRCPGCGGPFDSIYTHPVTGQRSRVCLTCQRANALRRSRAKRAA